jgi:hypothetical protein
MERLMTDTFNALELAVLDWHRTYYNNDRLSAQINSAILVERDWTKHGFYINFEIDKQLPTLILNDFSVLNHHGANWPLIGPFIHSPYIDIEAGSELWGKEGYIYCIEMFTFGDFFNENIGEFILSYP